MIRALIPTEFSRAPIIVKPQWVSTTIEELQRWIGQKSSNSKLHQGRTQAAKHYCFRVRSGDDESCDGNT